MHYTLTTPPPSRAADRPTPIDDALVAEARRLLAVTVASLPTGAAVNRRAMETLFAVPMTALCAAGRPAGVPVEKLIIAIKLAWASMAEARLSLSDAAPEALSGAVTACIKAYFRTGWGERAD
jgi:hypothetical protein